MAFVNFKLDSDSDGITLVTWDMPGKSMNVFDETVMEELDAIIGQTAADATVKGVVITSAKEFFCAGADINMLEAIAHHYAEMVRAQGEEAAIAQLFSESRKLSQLFRKLETNGKPWVAAINGTALGGGLELCLACH